MKKVYTILLAGILVYGCTGTDTQEKSGEPTTAGAVSGGAGKHFEGMLTKGMKGDKISFDISTDGKKLTNLTFIGYWRCDGKLESTTTGPEGSYDIVDGKVSGRLCEPPNGGSTAWCFELEALIDGDKAQGKFRMNINNLGCDTYLLDWTAEAK